MKVWRSYHVAKILATDLPAGHAALIVLAALIWNPRAATGINVK